MAVPSDEEVIQSAIAKARRVLVDRMRTDPDAISGPLDAAFLAPYLNLEAALRTERLTLTLVDRNRELVWLTRALVGLTIVLGFLTALLAWGSLR